MCLMAAAPTVPSDLRSLPPRAAEAPRNVKSNLLPSLQERRALLISRLCMQSTFDPCCHIKSKCRAKAHWEVNAWLSLKTSQIQHGQLCGTRHASSATVSFRTGMTRFAPTTGRSVLGPVCSPHKSALHCVAVSRAPPHDTGPAGSTGFSSSLTLALSRIKFPLASPAFIDRTMPDVCSGARPAGTISIRHKGAASLQAVSSRRPAWLTDRTWRAVSMLSPRTIPAAGLSTYGRVRPPETLAPSAFFPAACGGFLAPLRSQKSCPLGSFTVAAALSDSGGPDAPITVRHRRGWSPAKPQKETSK